MELEHNSLKQSLTNHIKKINFNGGTNYFLNHIQSLQNKHQNNNAIQHLSNIRNAINNCTSEINTMPMDGSKKMRGFEDQQSFVEYMISPYICNIQDTELLSDLLSFFDENILHTQELKKLTTRNILLTQENSNLINELKTAIEKIKQLQSKMEHLTNINLLQNDEILIIKEMIRDYQKK